MSEVHPSFVRIVRIGPGQDLPLVGQCDALYAPRGTATLDLSLPSGGFTGFVLSSTAGVVLMHATRVINTSRSEEVFALFYA